MNYTASLWGLLLLGAGSLFIGCESSPPSPTAAAEPLVLTVSDSVRYTPFPANFNYPETRTTIDRWVATGDLPAIRQHAWSLFAGINQPTASGHPVWETWYPVADVMSSPDTTPELQGTLHTVPPVVPMPPDTFSQPYPNPRFHTNCGAVAPLEGNRFIFTSFIGIPSSYYNQEVTDWIQGKALSKKVVLDSLQRLPIQNIPEAPSGAIIVKHLHWPVSGDPNEFTPLPVWDGDAGMDPMAYNGFETWERAVAITTQKNPPATVDVSYLYRYTNRDQYHYEYKNVPTVSVDKFYYLKLDRATLATFNAVDSCIVNNSFYYTFNRPFREGDYLALVATHIITKEIEDWCMQTAWWSDQPNRGPFAQNKPTNLPPGTWSHYQTRTAYYMAKPNAPGGKIHVSYNPYIELLIAEKNRIRSNCQNCHLRAGWPNHDEPFFIVDMVGSGNNFPTEKIPFYHTMQEGYISRQDTIFDGLVRTDMNWGIPDRAQ